MHTGHVLVGAYVYVSLMSSAVAHHQFLYDLGGWVWVLHYMSLYWSWFYIWCPKFRGTTMMSDWVYHYFGPYNVSWMRNLVPILLDFKRWLCFWNILTPIKLIYSMALHFGDGVADGGCLWLFESKHYYIPTQCHQTIFWKYLFNVKII